jgi:rubredoxin
MPHRTCPQCQQQGRYLEGASQSAWVDYYRCDVCGHVWALDKGDPNAPPRDITLPPVTLNR